MNHKNGDNKERKKVENPNVQITSVKLDLLYHLLRNNSSFFLLKDPHYPNDSQPTQEPRKKWMNEKL